MNKRIIKWNTNFCLFGSYSNPQSKCVFDYYSIYHFYFTGFAYIIIHYFLNLKKFLVVSFYQYFYH